MVMRRGGRQDVRFLRDMLHHAYYWRERVPGEEPGPVSRYVKGWGRPGDTALIAVEDGFPVGAGWYRMFRKDQPGYGFVDERTPELTIAVVPSRRNRGTGDALLVALFDQARAEGHGAISLSVERDNGALLRFYEKHGFTVVAEHHGDTLTLLRQL
ncbi:MAG TPA: GNAT family N-acetyltransferase [Gaiellaceae bacterium]|nr:GNAT family N-acetyltransferase [Gaiellaceae bacterium]